MNPPPDETQNRWPGPLHGMPAPPGWGTPGHGAAQRTQWTQPTPPSPAGWAPRPDQPAPEEPAKWVPRGGVGAGVGTLVVGAITVVSMGSGPSGSGGGGAPGVAAQTG